MPNTTTQWLGAPELRALAAVLDALDETTGQHGVTVEGEFGVPSTSPTHSGILLPLRYGTTDTDAPDGNPAERHRIGVAAGTGDLGPVTRA